MAKRKTLFDDRPIEISELTYIIRQDIASLNTQIASLQAYVRAQKAGGGAKGKQQVEEHNSNVVMMLQSRLANMGMGFKDVLELRTQNMKASKDRTEQFMHTASTAAVLPPAKGESGLGRSCEHAVNDGEGEGRCRASASLVGTAEPNKLADGG